MPASPRLRILLTNDDGPPSSASGHSPFIYPFALALRDQLNADVRVVVPASQQSWKGKAYMIGQGVEGSYYYPAGKDGTRGETRELPKGEEEKKDGEMEFILLDGTPSTCANIALHNLFAPDSFDVVVSGPNFGRNTSTAFALSSGTLGAALAASLSGQKAIAVSFGLMEGYKPPPKQFVDAAVKETCKIIQRLYDLGWGEREDKVDVYSVNVPLLPNIVSSPSVRWTTMAKTGYGALFKSKSPSEFAEFAPGDTSTPTPNKGGPAAVPEPEKPTKEQERPSEAVLEKGVGVKEEHKSQKLSFKFAPDLTALVNPDPNSLVEGTDKHALHSGAISIVPVRAAFAETKIPKGAQMDEKLRWKI
ncbi:hypothetical protein JCM8547_000967 [Rhodosporidiobolus lusitaniae]